MIGERVYSRYDPRLGVHCEMIRSDVDSLMRKWKAVVNRRHDLQELPLFSQERTVAGACIYEVCLASKEEVLVGIFEVAWAKEDGIIGSDDYDRGALSRQAFFCSYSSTGGSLPCAADRTRRSCCCNHLRCFDLPLFVHVRLPDAHSTCDRTGLGNYEDRWLQVSSKSLDGKHANDVLKLARRFQQDYATRLLRCIALLAY